MDLSNEYYSKQGYNSPNYMNKSNKSGYPTYQNLPKNLKSKIIIPFKGSMNTNMLSTKSSNSIKSPNTNNKSYSNNYTNSITTKNKITTSYINNNLEDNINTKRTRSSNKQYNRVKSPTRDIFNSNNKINNNKKSSLDYNYMADQKFSKDAFNCGNDRLNSKSLKNSSPEKYYYENKQENKNYIDLHNLQQHQQHQQNYNGKIYFNLILL
jgi:hypothetical protein